MAKKRVGIDIGAYSIKIVVLDNDGCVVARTMVPHRNKVKEKLYQIYKELLSENEDISVACTGGMSHLTGLKDICFIPEEQALIAGVKLLHPEAASCIHIGAQKTYYIELDEKKEPLIYQNSNCSAGTGAFFEEQATRLQIPLENISQVISQAKTIPQMAGRCSVFSKTDMIHKMQEGVPTPDILKGLCYALVRNYRSTIMKNQPVKTPTIFSGGVMQNAGVREALYQLLALSEEEVSLEDGDYVQAIGCAAMAKEQMKSTELLRVLEGQQVFHDNGALKPLYAFADEGDKPEYQVSEYHPGEEISLGIDIGSTSINFVALNEQRQVVYFSYVKTLGKPLDIVRREYEKLRQAIPNIQIEKTTVTGSGREYIGKEIGATLVINEISAQTEGAAMNYGDCDSIFEIGGQDSKYMSVRQGKMVDFEMNKVCAAGTGAFLEEQIKKLGITMEEYVTLSMKSEHPVELGNRCTVFIEGSINRALAQGHSMEDVCAGLAYAIASNYLQRVVNQKKVGDYIALQGGIAYNQAVVCAFRALTGKQVHVSPYFSVTGAMGAASLGMKNRMLTFDKENNQRFNEALNIGSEKSYLMDYHPPVPGSGKKVVGVPRVIFLHKMFPLFNALFTKLGFDVLLSPLTDREIVAKAQEYVTAETCYPIKLIYGHVAWLVEQKVDYIVLPRLYTIKHEGSVARHDYACMYMQSSPLFIEAAFHLKERGITLLAPQLSLEFGKKFMVNSILSMADDIGVPKPKMLPAAVSAFARLVAHSDRLEALGKGALDGDEPVFVLVSRVYNIIDPVLNMGIEKRLHQLGCKVIHLEHLEASYMNVEHDYKDMYWPFGQHILTGLKIIKANKNLYPIYITNHGCGPDTAIQHFFMNEMEGREYLQLEVDEHSSEVGIITRIEAFLYALQPQEALPIEREKPGEKASDIALIPDFGIYSSLIGKYLPREYKTVTYVKPLQEHHNFNYAMNKEYHSVLVLLEEILNTVKMSETYDLYFPIDEGSEVFGQYAFMVHQELLKRGFDVNLRTFYLEDTIKRPDKDEIFADMMKLEIAEYDRGQAEESDLERESASRKIYYLGEPLCLYKKFISKQGADETRANMPLSEALLFHMKSISGRKASAGSLHSWEKMHNQYLEHPLYTDVNDLFVGVSGKLDFLIGDFTRYRLAKLLCLKAPFEKAYLLHSAEENSAIILKLLQTEYRDEIPVTYKEWDLDFEHPFSKVKNIKS